MVGIFRYPEGERALWFANHNSRAKQSLRFRLRPEAAVAADVFDRGSGEWRPLPAEGGALELELAPAGGELVRLRGP